MPSANVHQILLEILAKFDGDLRVTAAFLEWCYKASNPPFRASQDVIEWANKAAAPDMLAAQVIIEVIRGSRRAIWYTDEAADSSAWFAF